MLNESCPTVITGSCCLFSSLFFVKNNVFCICNATSTEYNSLSSFLFYWFMNIQHKQLQHKEHISNTSITDNTNTYKYVCLQFMLPTLIQTTVHMPAFTFKNYHSLIV